MGTLSLDQHTQDRLEALMLILREENPAFALDRQELLQRALDRGLRVMLTEQLFNGRGLGNARERRGLRSA